MDHTGCSLLPIAFDAQDTNNGLRYESGSTLQWPYWLCPGLIAWKNGKQCSINFTCTPTYSNYVPHLDHGTKMVLMLTGSGNGDYVPKPISNMDYRPRNGTYTHCSPNAKPMQSTSKVISSSWNPQNLPAQSQPLFLSINTNSSKYLSLSWTTWKQPHQPTILQDTTYSHPWLLQTRPGPCTYGKQSIHFNCSICYSWTWQEEYLFSLWVMLPWPYTPHIHYGKVKVPYLDLRRMHTPPGQRHLVSSPPYSFFANTYHIFLSTSIEVQVGTYGWSIYGVPYNVFQKAYNGMV